MDKLFSKIEQPLAKITFKLAANDILMSIKDAFIFVMPFLVISSFIGVINLQLGYWFKDVPAVMTITQILGQISSTISNINGILIVISAALFYSMKVEHKIENFNKVTAVLGALVAYMIFVPAVVPVEGSEPVSAYGLVYLNYNATFVGIISTFSFIKLYGYLINKVPTIKLPDSVPPGIYNSFFVLIPLSIIFVIFATICITVQALGYASVQDLVVQWILTPLYSIGTGLPAIIIVILLMQLLWFFGLHGFSIMWGIISILWLPLFNSQIDAYAASGGDPSVITQVAPNVITNIYAMIGGSGATFGLIIALFICAPKNSAEREVAKISVIPGLFNINEPIIFGLPIVLNPIMFIPFVFIPVIIGIIAYVAMASGLVAPIVALGSGVEPIFLNVWVMSNFEITPVILYGFLLFVSTILYLPFAKMLVKNNQKLYENDLME